MDSFLDSQQKDADVEYQNEEDWSQECKVEDTIIADEATARRRREGKNEKLREIIIQVKFLLASEHFRKN